MESRLATKINGYVSTFKINLAQRIRNGATPEELLTYVEHYEELCISEDDFHKRKRSKNMVPLGERCIAQRIDGTQCSRRKQSDKEYCGTHIKGQPYGVICSSDYTENPLGNHTTKSVWCESVNGIYYYIDADGNVYNTEDIVSNKPNPRIIASYVKNNNEYSIPALFGK